MKAGWKTVQLASVSKVFTDGNWIESKDQASSGIRLVQTGNIGEGIFKDRRVKARWIDAETFDRLNCFEVLPGDCLISRLPDPVGRACLIPETGDKMITAVDCSIVRPDESQIDPSYLVYFSQSRAYLKEVDDRCTGTTRRRISRKNLGKVSIPLPPLEEQRRIVAVLDETFEGLARARENTEANLASARELLGQKLSALFSTEHPGWEKSSIEQLCEIKSGTTVPKSQELPTGDIPYVKVADMNLPANDKGVTTSSRFLNRSKISNRKVIPAGATIFPKRGGAIMTNKKRKAVVDICADLNVMAVIPSQKINADFLYNFFLALDMREIGSGSAVPQINNYDINPLVVSYPSALDEQARIAEECLELSQHVNALVAAYSEQSRNLENLRQSLLQKAFAGELT